MFIIKFIYMWLCHEKFGLGVNGPLGHIFLGLQFLGDMYSYLLRVHS